MPASSIPGYVQGFIFDQDDAGCYNATIKRFIDQSPFSAWDNNHLDITTGTPSFATLNGHKGMVLNNTVQGYFLCPCAWEGTIITVLKPGMTGNANVYPLVFGAAVSVASNGRLQVSGMSFRTSLVAASATTAGDLNYTTQAGQAAAFSFSQQARRCYGTKDGSTLVSGSVVTDGGSGVPVFAGSTDNAVEGFRTRFGNLSGTIGDFAASAHTVEMYEMHFFLPDAINSHAAEVTAFLAELKTKYGL